MDFYRCCKESRSPGIYITRSEISNSENNSNRFYLNFQSEPLSSRNESIIVDSVSIWISIEPKMEIYTVMLILTLNLIHNNSNNIDIKKNI